MDHLKCKNTENKSIIITHVNVQVQDRPGLAAVMPRAADSVP